MRNTLAEKPEKALLRTPELSKLAGVFIEGLDVGARSREVYRRALNQFLRWIECKGITRPTRQDILAYKRGLEGKSPFTASSYLTVVRGFFSYLETRKLYPNISAGIKNARKPSGPMRDPLTIEQVKTLLSIERDTLRGKRDFALLNLLLSTGLRCIEVVRANVEDLRQESGETVLWIQGKARSAKDEPVLLTPEVSGPLYEYLGLRGNLEASAPLFASLSGRNNGQCLTTRSTSRTVRTRLQEIGINSRRITAHSLRNTAINQYIKASGGDLIGAQTLARHSDPRTTQRYIKRVNRIEHAPERKVSEAFTQAGVYSGT